MNPGQQVIEHYLNRPEISSCARFQEGDKHSIWLGPLRQQVWADETIDDEGIIATRVHARTDLFSGFSGTDEQLGMLNGIMKRTALCGVIRCPSDPSRIQLASSVYAKDENVSWLSVFFALSAMVQMFQSHRLVGVVDSIVGIEHGKLSHPELGYVETNQIATGEIISLFASESASEESPFIGTDMLDILADCQNPPCILANGDKSGVSAEFPFLGATSLLRATTIEGQSLLGSGLLLALQIPDQQDQGVTRCLELNERELSELTRCHFLGNWCMTSEDQMTHICYIPNNFQHPGIASVNAQSMIMRAMWIAEGVFGDDWFGGGYEVAMKNKSALMARFIDFETAKQKPKRGILSRLFGKG
jgi:hypothetical protein